MDEQFTARCCQLIQQRTGMIFSNGRRASLEQALQENMASRHTSLEEYYACLESAPTDSETWRQLIQQLTVCESYFFRDAAQIEALRQEILPELIRRREAQRKLRLWSAGCAAGEEPYTLAMLLTELLPDLQNWDISILATDINRKALEQARSAEYRPWALRSTDPAARAKYFTQQGEGYGITYALSPAIRCMVDFRYHNLADMGPYPQAARQIDLILWRNVSIYLPEQVTRQIAARFYDCLSPEGWLMVAPSEANADVYHQYALRRFDGAILFQKSGLKKPLESEQGARSGAAKLAASVRKPATCEARPATGEARPAACEARPLAGAAQTGSATPEALQAGETEPGFEDRDRETLRNSPASCCQLARQHANRGRLGEAESWVRLALEREPLRSEAHYTLALIRQEGGKLLEALDELKKTLYLDADFVLAYFSLADLSQALGHGQQAPHYRQIGLALAKSLPPDEILPGSDDLTARDVIFYVSVEFPDR